MAYEILRFFPGATSLLKGATLIDFWFFKNFLRLFNFLFLWVCIKDSNYLLFKRGLRLFKELCLLFLPNVPGATFIQGGTLIPDSRVRRNFIAFWGRIHCWKRCWWPWWNQHHQQSFQFLALPCHSISSLDFLYTRKIKINIHSWYS